MLCDSNPNVHGVLLIVVDKNEVDFRFAYIAPGLIYTNRFKKEE